VRLSCEDKQADIKTTARFQHGKVPLKSGELYQDGLLDNELVKVCPSADPWHNK
jgi:hypothetical protein